MKHQCDPRKIWFNVVEQVDPFADNCEIKERKAANVAPRVCKAWKESLTDWIIYHCEYDWSGGLRSPQRSHDRSTICDNDIGGQSDHFRHILIDRLKIAPGKPIFDLNVASFDPAQIAHARAECLDALLRFGVLFVETDENGDPACPLTLLGTRNKRPSGC